MQSLGAKLVVCNSEAIVPHLEFKEGLEFFNLIVDANIYEEQWFIRAKNFILGLLKKAGVEYFLGEIREIKDVKQYDIFLQMAFRYSNSFFLMFQSNKTKNNNQSFKFFTELTQALDRKITNNRELYQQKYNLYLSHLKTGGYSFAFEQYGKFLSKSDLYEIHTSIFSYLFVKGLASDNFTKYLESISSGGIKNHTSQKVSANSMSFTQEEKEIISSIFITHLKEPIKDGYSFVDFYNNVLEDPLFEENGLKERLFKFLSRVDEEGLLKIRGLFGYFFISHYDVSVFKGLSQFCTILVKHIADSRQKI